MRKFTLKRDYDRHELPEGFDHALAKLKIRIWSGEGESITVYYEGSIGKFVIERLPSQSLLDLLPRLQQESSLTYRLQHEDITIDRIGGVAAKQD
jgi:hypothetical protein